MTRALNRAITDDVRRALETELGRRCKVFARCETISQAVSELRSDDDAGIVTSQRAFEAYDPKHPERIACVLIQTKPVNFLIVVNDREMKDVAAVVRHWRRGQFHDPNRRRPECAVCFAAPKKLVVCHACYAATCLKCDATMRSCEGCKRCPVCRTWELDGGDFGVPLEPSSFLDSVDEPAKHAVDAFLDDVVRRLDGRMVILPRVDTGFLMDDGMCVSKLARTDRYAEGSDTIAQARRSLRWLFDRHLPRTSDLHIWLTRKTFRIDEETDRPVEEVSVFRVVGDPAANRTRLVQLEPEAWKNVLEVSHAAKAAKAVKAVKVAYLRPVAIADPPAKLQSLFETVAREESRVLTVSLTTLPNDEEDESLGANFDVDARGHGRFEVTTMSPYMLRARLRVLVEHPRHPLLIMIRVHPGDGHGDACEVAAFEYRPADDELALLSPEDCERHLAKDTDGLSSSKRTHTVIETARLRAP